MLTIIAEFDKSYETNELKISLLFVHMFMAILFTYKMYGGMWPCSTNPARHHTSSKGQREVIIKKGKKHKIVPYEVHDKRWLDYLDVACIKTLVRRIFIFFLTPWMKTKKCCGTKTRRPQYLKVGLGRGGVHNKQFWRYNENAQSLQPSPPS